MPRTILVKHVWGKADVFRVAKETEVLGVFKFVSDNLGPKAAVLLSRGLECTSEYVVIETGVRLRARTGQATYYIAIPDKKQNQYVIEGQPTTRVVVDRLLKGMVHHA